MAGADSELVSLIASGGIWSAIVVALGKYIWDRHAEKLEELKEKVGSHEREIAGLMAQKGELANIEQRLERRIDKMELRTEADMNGLGERINSTLADLREDINGMREAYSRLLEHLMNKGA